MVQKKMDKDADKVPKKIKTLTAKNLHGSLCSACGLWLTWWMIVECFNNSNREKKNENGYRYFIGLFFTPAILSFSPYKRPSCLQL